MSAVVDRNFVNGLVSKSDNFSDLISLSRNLLNSEVTGLSKNHSGDAVFCVNLDLATASSGERPRGILISAVLGVTGSEFGARKLSGVAVSQLVLTPWSPAIAVSAVSV